MLRYIIGLSIISIGIIIIRALSNGKILKKYQYAFWIAIPVCMLLLPFVKIEVPVTDMIGLLFSSRAETTVAISDQISSDYTCADEPVERSYQIDQNSNSEAVNTVRKIQDREPIPVQNIAVEEHKVKEDLNIEKIIEVVSFAVSIVLISLLIIYNVGFAIYCRHKRKYIGRDLLSGLKIYSIRHRATPFLLFNKIYVEDDPDQMNGFIICHEACHYKHGDFIWVLIRYIVLFINWYNPVIWAAFILSGRDSELACDEEVLRIVGNDSSAGYVDTLIDLLERHCKIPFAFNISIGMNSGFKTMRKRILNIKRPAGMSRRVLALSLAAIMLFSSCSFINTPKQVKKVSEDDPWFDTTRLEIDISDKGTQIGFEPISSDDENIYLFCDIIKDPATKEEYEETGGGSVWGEVIKYSYKDKKIVWDRKVDNNSSVFRYKGDLVIMTSVQDPDTYQDKRSLYRMDDATGEIKEEIKESKILKILNSLPGGSGVAKYIPQESGLAFCVKRNNMDGSYSPIIYLVDDAGNVTTKYLQAKCKELQITDDFDYCKMNENEILVRGGNWNMQIINHVNHYSGFIYNTADDTYKDIDENSPLLLGDMGEMHRWRYCGDGICYSDNYGVDKYDPSSDTVIRSLDFNNANTDRFEFLGDMRPLAQTDTRIVMGGMAQYTPHDCKYVIYVFDKAEKNPNTGKTVITVADTVDDFTAGLSRAIYEFNNTNSDVYVAMDDRYFLKNYMEEDEKADYRKDQDDYFVAKSKWNRVLSSRMTSKLRMDILSGKGPDIILNASSYSQLDNGNVFVDLSGRLDDLDQDLYRTVIGFFKTDDRLYQVPVSFYASGMTEILYGDHGAYYNNPFGYGKTGVTFDEFEDYVKMESNGKNYLTFYYSRDELFMLLFKRIEKELIKDGRFDADCDLFRKTADYAMSTSGERSYKAELNDMNDEEELSHYYDDIKLVVQDLFSFPGTGVVGVPSADGSVGPMAYSEDSAGITCSCADPDAAWEFVSYLLTPSGQKTIIDYRYPKFAINRDAMKDIAYEYEKGLMTPDPERYYYDPMEPDRDPAKMPPVPTEEEIRDKTDQEMKKAEDFIPSLTGSLKGNSDIEIVVLEEMGAYFTKDKTLDEVIPIINNRVNLILAETHK